MNWHPLICGPESVRAYLAGTKSQTRRVVKPQPVDFYRTGDGRTLIDAVPGELMARRIVCPHGVPGDGLYISEAVTILDVVAGNTLARIRYNADGTEPAERLPIPERIKVPRIGRWRGRIMPHEWSRIFRELVEVRVERVQEIVSDKYKLDVFDEGICFVCEYSGTVYAPDNSEPPDICGGHGGVGCHEESGELYRRWWDSLNAKRGHGWDTNPWVWVLMTKETEQRPEFLQQGDVR